MNYNMSLFKKYEKKKKIRILIFWTKFQEYWRASSNFILCFRKCEKKTFVHPYMSYYSVHLYIYIRV